MTRGRPWQTACVLVVGTALSVATWCLHVSCAHVPARPTPCLTEPPPPVRQVYTSRGDGRCPICMSLDERYRLDTVLVGLREWSSQAWERCGPRKEGR